MKKYLPFILFFSATLQAQKLARNWVFGDTAGIQFNGNQVSVLKSAKIRSDEGISCISDSAGNLLFYSNGPTIWNSDNDTMENGDSLIGHTTTTQSTLIVPQPNNPGIYYLFTLAPQGWAGGLRYSIIDMNLNTGRGKVTSKNVPLYNNPLAEKLAGYSHANKTDFWIAVHHFNENKYFTFRLTEAGIKDTVVSITGNPDSRDGQGYLKISYDGRMAASALSNKNIDILCFNNQTGHFRHLYTLTQFRDSYGVEFSPSGRFLYASDINQLVQYDLSAGDKQLVNDSRTVLSTADTGITALQLGPDMKIYVAHYNNYNPWSASVLGNYLGIIHTPDKQGNDAGYQKRGIFLEGGRSKAGLPNFIPNFITNSYPSADTCKYIADTSTNPQVASDLYIPNVFSPNNDARNDSFFVRGLIADDFHVKIFNRYNLMVYESADGSFSWNGTIFNREIPADWVYFYVIVNNGKTYKGTITLLN